MNTILNNIVNTNMTIINETVQNDKFFKAMMEKRENETFIEYIDMLPTYFFMRGYQEHKFDEFSETRIELEQQRKTELRMEVALHMSDDWEFHYQKTKRDKRSSRRNHIKKDKAKHGLPKYYSKYCKGDGHYIGRKRDYEAVNWMELEAKALS